MKGLLDVEEQEYPTRQKGHIIPHVGNVFGDYFGVALPTDLLQAIDCKSAVRYGDEEATREDAVAAHVALLKLLPMLAQAYNKRPSRVP